MTRANDARPVRRLMSVDDVFAKTHDYVVTITGRAIVVRPKGARAAGAIVDVTPDRLYRLLLAERHGVRSLTKSRPRRRGR